ncbi:MAG: glutathione S-transferase family protein [Pseudomonadales bacterium]|nr:glutathione S-transferase family protein [Pseudomonadales bacterium]
MKLYKVALAPNPTKVMLYIAERKTLGTDIGIEQITVNTVKGEHRQPEHLARNPFGTVPALELDDGSFILESLAIMQYLEAKFPEGRLMDGTPEEQAHAWDIERIIDIRLASNMGAYGHATNSPLGYPADPERAAQLLSNMQAPLDYLEQLLADGRPLFMGDRVTIADCTMQASLQFMRFVEADVMGDRPNLRAWDERYRERPAAQAVLKW